MTFFLFAEPLRCNIKISGHPFLIASRICPAVSGYTLLSNVRVTILFFKSETLQTTQSDAFAVPQKIAVNVGHLLRDADLVVVEIGEILCFVLVIVEDLRQGFIAVFVGVDLGVAAFVGVLLK